MRKSCAVCTAEFEAKRPHSKYCGDTCRKRAQRQPGGSLAAAVLVTPAEQASESSGDRPVGEVTAATLAELEAAGRDGTANGRAALALARRIDGGIRETGSALAALVREHRAAMAEAIKNATADADPLDELKMRRERKLGTH